VKFKILRQDDLKDSYGIDKVIESLSSESTLLLCESYDGISLKLSSIVDDFIAGKSTLSMLSQITDFHTSMLKRLNSTDRDEMDDLNDLLVDAHWLLEDEVQDSKEYIYDQVVSLGPLLASKIIYYQILDKGIDAAWIDARDFVVTDDGYKNPKLDLEKSKYRLNSIMDSKKTSKVIVTQFGIGSTIDNTSTTFEDQGFLEELI
jgi:aspartate kinase